MNMTASYLICLTADGGVPLFSLVKGNLNSLPFPIIGSLNGIHMFANNHGVELISSYTNDSKVLWKTYYNSVKLILITKNTGPDDYSSSHLIDLVFSSMILLYGLDDLTNIKNVERCKKELKVAYQLINTILNGPELPVFADLCQSVDLIISNDNLILQDYLMTITMGASSAYGCLYIHHKVACATDKWWTLTGTELSLITLLMISFPPATSRDIPIFLPDTSPTVPHRLMTFQLLAGIEVVIISGPSPPLAHLQQEVARFWTPALPSCFDLLKVTLRNFPSTLQIDSNCLGFILNNTVMKRSLCTFSINKDDNSDDSMSHMKIRATLRDLYSSLQGRLFPVLSDDLSTDVQSQFSHRITESYRVTDEWKSYALQDSDYSFCVLFSTAIPIYALRSVSKNMFKTLTTDRLIQTVL